MPELLSGMENSEIEEYETSSQIWKKEAMDLTGEELLNEFRKDGMVLVHRSYHGNEVLESGFLKPAQLINIEKGKPSGHEIFLRPSAGVHFTLNRPYSGGIENRSLDSIPMVPAKVVLSKEEAKGKDLVPAHEVLFVTHPGIMADHYAIDLNLKKYSGTDFENRDIEIQSQEGKYPSPEADLKKTELDLRYFILLAPKNLIVDEETGLPFPEGQGFSEESWHEKYELNPMEEKFSDGESIWHAKDETGFMKRPIRKPEKFGIRSEEYWNKIIEKLRQENKPLPKGVYFYESNNPGHGYEEWRKKNQIPDKPNLDHLRYTLGQFEMFGTMYSSSADNSTTTIGKRSHLREFFWVKPKKE